jgi:hypothetical protein
MTSCAHGHALHDRLPAEAAPDLEADEGPTQRRTRSRERRDDLLTSAPRPGKDRDPVAFPSRPELAVPLAA